nr:unnamed protein product [Callosobruchus analis]
MRQLARLLVELRKTDSEKNWLSCWLKPQHFDDMIESIKSLCKFETSNISRPGFSIPSLALKLGHALRKCVAIEKGFSIGKGDVAGVQMLTSFLSLMDLEWSVRISSNALNTLHVKKINAVELLPLTDDLVKLNSFLNNKILFHKQALHLAPQRYEERRKLASYTLCKIVLFNKRRSGEAAKMTILNYTTRPNWSQAGTDEYQQAMSDLERQLANSLSLVQISGKRGRIVSVLLSNDVKEVIDLLLDTRERVNIPGENLYLFAAGGSSMSHLRGHDVLRMCSTEANLIRPDLINSTKLRKYIATVSQVFNLTENETNWLARHLGHDIRVHREFYRLHDSSIELTKVSRILLALERGEASKFAGKPLNEIALNGKVKQRAPCKKNKWSAEETEAVLTFFKADIKMTIPGKEKCEECIAKKTSGGKRVRNKDHSCYFCHKLLRNLSRHFEKVHANETEVARILSMPKNSKRRREAFNALTRNGGFYHNCEAYGTRKKFLRYSDYGPCPECLGFMIKRHLWHHLKYSCACMRDKNVLTSEKSLRLPAAESTTLLNEIYGHSLTEDFRSNILNKLRNDEISEICRKDYLILRFGAFVYEKYSSTQAELIRQSMRQLGRLTIAMARKNEHVQRLTDALTLKMFDAVVSATKSICLISQEVAKRTEFGIPSLVLKIGYSIRKCIGIERGLSLRKDGLKRNEALLAFLSILDLEWSTRISSSALATLQSRKLNSVDLLPVTGDLIKLNKYLECMIQQTKNHMEREKNFQNLTEMRESLTEFETKLANALTVVEIIGKREGKVPVLLTKEMKESIDFLLATRTSVGVPEENPFVFARLANLESPETVTSTKLRKYVVCQVFNLKENECDWLARHLGHDIRVHREFYRSKVNRLLLAVDQGKAHTFAGKSLEDKERYISSHSRISTLGIKVNRSINTLTKYNIFPDLPPIEDDDPDQNDEASDEEEETPKENVKVSVRNSKPKRTKREAALGRVPWNDSEKVVLLKTFKIEIKKEIVPGKCKCLKIKEAHNDILSRRSWTDIKFFVKNVITRNKTKMK